MMQQMCLEEGERCGEASLMRVMLEPSGTGAPNFELLQVTDAMLTHTSSMMTECAVLGVPCGFLTQGWDGAEEFISRCFGGVLEKLPRLRDPEQVDSFLVECTQEDGKRLREELQAMEITRVNQRSSIDICWECILETGKFTI